MCKVTSWVLKSRYFSSLLAGQVCLFENFLTETLLPKGIMRKLSEEEMAEYVAPFKNEGEDRRPTLFLPREIPIECFFYCRGRV